MINNENTKARLWKELIKSNYRSSRLVVLIKVLKFPHKTQKTTRGFQDKTCNFIKKETLAQVFSCEFCEISENTFLTEHLWATAFRGIL